MNLSKNLLLSGVLIASIFTTSCKKFIDCVNPPSSQPTAGCKIVSTTEMVPFDIYRTGYESCQTGDCVVDYAWPVEVVRKFYYNADGNPDSIIWIPFGKDTVYTVKQTTSLVNLYFKYDAQKRLSGYLSRSSYTIAPLPTTGWQTYTYPDAHTIKVNGSQTIILDDSMRVIADGDRTYEYDQNGNLELNPYNDNSMSNQELDDIGLDARLSYTLDKKSPRQLNWVFMFIDRDFSKNPSELFTEFNVSGYPERMGGPGHIYAFGYQDVLFGLFPWGNDYLSTGDRSIQYACTETPPSKK